MKHLALKTALIAAGLLCALPALLPWHDHPIPSFYAEWTAAALGLAAMLALAHRSRGPLPWMTAGLAAFVCVLGVQVALGRVAFAERSTLAMLTVYWLALLVMAGQCLAEQWGSERLAACLQAAMAAGAFLMALSGLMQFYRIEVLGVRILPEHVVGLVGQRNHLASIVSCGLWSLAYLWAGRKVSAATVALAALPMVMVLPLSGSRAVWVFALAAAAVAALHWSPRDERSRRLLLMTMALWTALAIAQLHLDAESGNRLTAALAEGGNLGDRLRVVLARYAWVIFQQHPLLGAGFGEFAWNVFALAPGMGVTVGRIVDHQAHNLALQLLAETGLLGAAAILVPMAAWLLRHRWRSCSGASAAHAWMGCVVLIILAQSLVEFPLWYAYLAGPLALVMGMGCAKPHSPSPLHIAALRPRWALPVAALVMGTLVLGTLMRDFRAIVAWRAELDRGAAAGRPMTQDQAARLIALRDSAFAWRIEPAVAAMVGDAPGSAALAAALTERALRSHPHPELAERYVRLLASAGREQEAAHWREAGRVAFGEAQGVFNAMR